MLVVFLLGADTNTLRNSRDNTWVDNYKSWVQQNDMTGYDRSLARVMVYMSWPRPDENRPFSDSVTWLGIDYIKDGSRSL